MGKIEKRWRRGMSRREALAGLASFLAASPLLHAQRDPWPLGPHRRFLGFDEMRDVFDFEPIFRANVPLSVYDYTAHGTESEFTLYRNRDAFAWVDLIDRGGVDPKDVDTSKELFGHRMPSPIMLAPTARQRTLHPDGELGMHRAATTTGTTMVVSNVSSFPFARIAQTAEGPLWFQRYATREMEPNRVALGGAQEVGAQTIVVTIDQQASFYERDLHDRHLGGTPRPGDAADAAEPREPVPGRRRPAVVRVATLRRPAADVPSPDAGQGDPDRRGREKVRGARLRRRHRLQPRRARHRLRSLRAWKCSKRWSKRWAAGCRCSSTAASAAAATR